MLPQFETQDLTVHPRFRRIEWDASTQILYRLEYERSTNQSHRMWQIPIPNGLLAYIERYHYTPVYDVPDWMRMDDGL